MNFKYASYTVLIFLITLLCLSTVSAVEDTNVTDNYQLPINDTNPVTGETSGRYLINISEEVEYSDNVIITVNINDTRFPDYPVDYPNDYLDFVLTDSQGNEWYNRIKDITNGTGIVPIYNNPNLTVGTYGVYCYYFDGYDWIGELTTNITILKGNPVLNIDVNDIWYGEIANIKVNINQFNATGNITITINGKNYTSNIINRTSSFSISDLDAGKYTIDAIYNGNEKYNVAKANTTFNVNKFDSSVIVSAGDIFVGDDAIIIVNVSDGATGIVAITVNSKQYNVTLDDGTGILKLSNLTSGEYNVSANYLGDNKYLPSENTTTFKVNKLNTPISVVIDNKTDVVIIKVIVPNDATGNITITVDGKNYTSEIINGTANIKISGLNEGNYNITIYYDGDDKYLANSTNSSFVIQFNHDDNKTDVDDNTSIDLNNDNVIDSEENSIATDNNKSTNLNLNTGNPLLILLMALIMLIPLRKRK